MKGIIIYKGKYGATKQYARWASEMLNMSAVVPEMLSARQFADSDVVILGSSVYTGKLLLAKWIKQHVNLLQEKKIVLFIVCATSSSDKKALNAIIQNNVPETLRPQCDIYFLHGKVIHHQLSWKDRLLINLGAYMEKDPVKKKAMKADFDDVECKYLLPLVTSVKKILTGANMIKAAS